ncbi:hypothetical protein [Flavobacterium sp. ACAM 123]|uniref:hypothetical protein n=1 Tax=Flavobacterium sp. ACAM 123 TaxID=1189620 RepID=UPI00293431DE|nr:hypothetical protein [Flavobacterium sp. ACAM 123]
MTASSIGRYSKYIRPISILVDLMVISIVSFYLFENQIFNIGFYIIYLIIGWCVVAVFIHFYDVYRFTAPTEIIAKISKQGVLFLLIVLAFFPFSKQYAFNEKNVIFFIIVSIALISISKFVLFYLLKKYRIITGSNFRNVIIIGYSPEAIRLKKTF